LTATKSRYADVDREVRKLVRREVPDSSFQVHLTRLSLLIQRKVQDKELADEMMNEIRLVVDDLHTRINRL
jgi:hypothetical protein